MLTIHLTVALSPAYDPPTPGGEGISGILRANLAPLRRSSACFCADNVVRMMQEKGARLGGEGSSGGLIDGSFNYCRDSVLAALVIIRGIGEKGGKLFDEVRSYHQQRGVVQLARKKGLKAVRALARKKRDADTTDGVKVWVSRTSWVLVRPSNTEDIVRVSAEAETAGRAAQLVRLYSRKVRELSR